ncbi:MAG: HIT family hydrolase [Thiobacillus sp. SCN 64-35]|nr:MAG: HIT family hydrolase [Thiobacillus sp. SCN 64-35]
MDCPLCDAPGGELLWQDDFCRVVYVTDTPGYPGFCRVILKRHAKEMTDLAPPERSRLMMTVMKTEQAIRDTLNPDKINLASLGNVVPHLHWHVIPRFADDPHFPNPIWGERRAGATHAAPPDLAAQLARHLRDAFEGGR